MANANPSPAQDGCRSRSRRLRLVSSTRSTNAKSSSSVMPRLWSFMTLDLSNSSFRLVHRLAPEHNGQPKAHPIKTSSDPIAEASMLRITSLAPNPINFGMGRHDPEMPGTLMDLSKIKTLIDFVGQSKITELSVTEKNVTVRIFRNATSLSTLAMTAAAPGTVSAVPAAAALGNRPSTFSVKAPVLGVLHRTPAPGEAPFVRLGDEVEEGQTLFVIEAMKVFNSISAQRSGRIVFLTDIDGGEVETGRPSGGDRLMPIPVPAPETFATKRLFDSVLIANRGEIAARIQAACRALDLKTVCVCSEADRDAAYGKTADSFLCIGPSSATKSYLNRDALLLAARLTGAGAIHPGYGFLSENAAFAEAVEKAGLVFIGPDARSIAIMGDKISAKRAMLAAGVPCVPGPDTALPDDPSVIEKIANEIGYPVIIKATAGGGGRGMRVVAQADQLHDAIALTREEARQAFGSAELYMEKFLRHPRHIEIQVLCDSHGNAVWLGHRDCSMQRRHQKVVEEAPAPGVAEAIIAPVGEACVKACQQIGYRGVGTFEFLYEDGAFYFIEMNTRLQVEHPVTEMTSGVDIVQEQIRAAQGVPLAITQPDVTCNGHSFECRINAEDPESFLSSAGVITDLSLPQGEGIRVDTHIQAGYKVSPYYDSLIAKVIVHAPTRAQAMEKMRQALGNTRIDGISTNIGFLQTLFEDEAFATGETDIHYLEQWLKLRSKP
ncbi:MAG: acetyl-CoA carboxylase biotin carboxylase subunit [Rhizobium sp.]|nr:acetyl-CoA carboxylase biotin carboxylase subunit [Rhizobium sp.]